jgi:WD40 repeat protein
MWTVDDRIVRLWDLPGWAERKRFDQIKGQGVADLAFSPDGRRAMFACTGGEVQVLDRESGLVQRLRGHTKSVWGVAYSLSTARNVVVSGSDDGTVRLWDVDRLEELRRFVGHTKTVGAVALSGDGRRIISSGVGEHALRVWDVASGRQLFWLIGHTDTIYGAALSADGRRALPGRHDGTVGL